MCGRPVAEGSVFCSDCGSGGRYEFESGRAVYAYTGIMKEAMYRFKYLGRREYADVFADDAIRMWKRWLIAINPEVIIPVPMYGPKKKKRGYDQAEVFANKISERIHVPVRNDIIIRNENTIPMKGLSPGMRVNNVKNAFLIKESEVQFKRILVVDDIFTTGATINAVSGVLRNCFNCRVFGLYICTGIGDYRRGNGRSYM